MRFLKISTFSLHKFDWKTFDYPKLAFSKRSERNGLSEFEDVTQAYVYGSKRQITLYYSTGSVGWRGVKDEVDLFNSDPEKYWKELLIPVLAEHCDELEESIEEKKLKLKKTQKMLKKLKGE